MESRFIRGSGFDWPPPKAGLRASFAKQFRFRTHMKGNKRGRTLSPCNSVKEGPLVGIRGTGSEYFKQLTLFTLESAYSR